MSDISSTRYADDQFKCIVHSILNKGSVDIDPRPKYADGTPAHTKSINHVTQTFDLTKGQLPLLSLRPISYKSAIGEILWIYQDQTTDLDVLKDKYNIKWWDDWEINGSRTIGQCYGATVKRWDMMNKLLEGIKKDPDSRRHILDLWQFNDFEYPHGLKPCALYSQYNVVHKEDGGYLDAFLLLRSSDYLTAGAINQIQYVVLQHLIARHTGYKVGKFTNFIVNCQCYDRHIANAEKMLHRSTVDANPTIWLNPEKKNFYDFTIDDIKINDYPVDEIKKVNPQLKFDLGI